MCLIRICCFSICKSNKKRWWCQRVCLRFTTEYLLWCSNKKKFITIFCVVPCLGTKQNPVWEVHRGWSKQNKEFWALSKIKQNTPLGGVRLFDSVARFHPKSMMAEGLEDQTKVMHESAVKTNNNLNGHVAQHQTKRGVWSCVKIIMFLFDFVVFVYEVILFDRKDCWWCVFSRSAGDACDQRFHMSRQSLHPQFDWLLVFCVWSLVLLCFQWFLLQVSLSLTIWRILVTRVVESDVLVFMRFQCGSMECHVSPQVAHASIWVSNGWGRQTLYPQFDWLLVFLFLIPGAAVFPAVLITGVAQPDNLVHTCYKCRWIWCSGVHAFPMRLNCVSCFTMSCAMKAVDELSLPEGETPLTKTETK